MAIDSHLLEIIACPQCKGSLSMDEQMSSLHCESCKLKYPVRDQIPVLIVSEAIDLKSGQSVSGGAHVKLSRVPFRVLSGPDKNMTFHLEQGSCRAIGRAVIDPNKTAVFNVDVALAIDDSTRDLIVQYISRQFKRSADAQKQAEGFGKFKRASDIVLSDGGLSRLHAMLFYDDSGIGVLDLVSKNGTFLNGKEIESAILKSGDVIELGESTIVFDD